MLIVGIIKSNNLHELTKIHLIYNSDAFKLESKNIA